MSLARLLAAAVPWMALALPPLGLSAVSADEDAAASFVREAPAAALVERLDAPEFEARFSAARELRRRGPAVAAVLVAACREARPVVRRSAEGLLVRIREDWHRSRTPEGMVYVPEGTVVRRPRGDAKAGLAGRHGVHAYYLDRTEVTVGAWRAWLLKTAGALDPETRRAYFLPLRGLAEGSENQPVADVTWDQAMKYAAFRGGRLPDVEEYERSLRGGGTRDWPWGSEMLAQRANLNGYGPGAPMPVGSFPLGAGPFGALDLVGNVAEWTSTTHPWGLGGWPKPLIFGGSFRDEPDPRLARGHVDSDTPLGGDSSERVGFRVARDVDPLPGEEGAPGAG